MMVGRISICCAILSCISGFLSVTPGSYIIIGAVKIPKSVWYSAWSLMLVWSLVSTKMVLLNHDCLEALSKNLPSAISV